MSEVPSRLEIVTDVETKDVVLRPCIKDALPGDLEAAFRQVDEVFEENPETYLGFLEESVFNFQSSQGGKVSGSLLYGPDSKPDELMVLLAAFADGGPKTSSDQIYDYISSETSRAGVKGLATKEKAAPNSYNQITKSSATFELLKALGKNLPVLTVFSPVPLRAYNPEERRAFSGGDFGPAARLVDEAIAQAQQRLHGGDSETRIKQAHLSGQSLGASNAIGAGAGLLSQRFIKSVTAQELIMGPANLRDLALRFTLRQYVGEPSDEAFSGINGQVPETALRRAIDGQGSELIGTNARMAQGALKLPYMRGLTRPAKTAEAVQDLLNEDVNVLVSLAANSAVSRQTADYLPSAGEVVVKLSGRNGQRLGHLANEHVALNALVTALNVFRR